MSTGLFWKRYLLGVNSHAHAVSLTFSELLYKLIVLRLSLGDLNFMQRGTSDLMLWWGIDNHLKHFILSMSVKCVCIILNEKTTDYVSTRQNLIRHMSWVEFVSWKFLRPLTVKKQNSNGPSLNEAGPKRWTSQVMLTSVKLLERG